MWGWRSSPSDHECALYVLPRGFRKAYGRASRAVKHAVDRVKQKGHWGGRVHITLSSFSEPSNTCESMRQAARSAAGAGNQILKAGGHRTFHITADKWKKAGDCWEVHRQSTTLQAVTQAVSNAGALNPRKQKKLHVYLPLKDSHTNEMIAFLAELKWDVAVVSIKRGDKKKQGTSLRVHSRHRIGK